MKQIPLTQGKYALVDDEDYEWLMQWKWRYQKGREEFGSAVRSKWSPVEKRDITIKMSRIIMGAPKGLEVDHIDHNSLDNRRCNLRVCTRQQNNMNTRKRLGSSSKYKGVYWAKDRKTWHARITKDGKTTDIGYFLLETEAARAYDEAAKKLHGEFACLNLKTPVGA